MKYFYGIVVLLVAVSATNPVGANSVDEALDTWTVYEDKQPIPEGRRDLFEAIGMLMTDHGKCTATLIGRRTLLTAAHCWNTGYAAVWRDSTGRTIPVIAGYRLDEESHMTDIAVLYLAFSIDDITPLKVADYYPSGVHQLMLAGFGCNGIRFSDGGPQYRGCNSLRENYISSLDYDAVKGTTSRMHILPGDSGSALIDRQVGVIVGVASRYDGYLIGSRFFYSLAYFAPVAPLSAYIAIID